MKTRKNQAFITERNSQGNSFGDRTFTISVVVLDHNGEETLAEKIFQETAFEGQHADIKRLMTKDIKAWAKENNAIFKGSI